MPSQSFTICSSCVSRACAERDGSKAVRGEGQRRGARQSGGGVSSSCVSRAITWTDTCSSLSGHSVRPIVASSAVAVEWEISPAQSESETIDRGPAFA